jgi:hypothetical protein
MPEGRVAKTVEKLRRGGLPVSSGERAAVESGNGQRCDGCGELIPHLVRMFVVVIPAVAIMRLHDDCYEAWAAFRRP